MPLRSRLSDGMGDGHEAQVTHGQALVVSAIPANPNHITFERGQFQHWQNDYFYDEPTGALISMAVDGSITEQRFCAKPTDERHVFIERVRVTIWSGLMKLDSNETRGYGAAATLANGMRLEFQQAGETFDIFLSPVTGIGDYYRYADSDGIVGQTDGISAGVDWVIVTFSFPRPLAMEAGSTDCLTFVVADNLTGLVKHEAEYVGYHVNVD